MAAAWLVACGAAAQPDDAAIVSDFQNHQSNVEVTADGCVQIDDQPPAAPTLQERRAILYAAHAEIEALKELVEILEKAK